MYTGGVLLKKFGGRMKMFHDYTFKWWQLGVFKLSLLSIGAIIGSYWSQFVSDYLFLFVTVAVLATAYIIYLALKQK
jgi:uncharacterized membrane protein YoaK (UPF0700 family)